MRSRQTSFVAVWEAKLRTMVASVNPWRWPLHRLIGFAVLNAAVAAGIAVGFTSIPS
jgi:hypothetical protein